MAYKAERFMLEHDKRYTVLVGECGSVGTGRGDSDTDVAADGARQRVGYYYVDSLGLD